MIERELETPSTDGAGATLADVLAWAESVDENYYARCELKKVPARLGLHDDDLALISADLGHFARRIAPSSYAGVSRAGDLRTARSKANSRLNSLLRRFHDAGQPTLRDAARRADWDALIAHVAERTGPNGPFSRRAEMPLYLLRARARCAPRDLGQPELERIAGAVDKKRRQTLREAVALLERLRNERVNALAALLPDVPLVMPSSVVRLPKLQWDALPAAFRACVDRTLDDAVSSLEDQADEAFERLLAGDSVDDVREAFNEKTSRAVTNPQVSRKGYREAIAWLVHAYRAQGGCVADLRDIRDVFSIDRLRNACKWQVERARRSPHLLDPEKSQTLHTRLTNLRVVAARGIADERLALAVTLALKKHGKDMRKPGDDLATEIEAFCRLIQSSPHVACMIVNAPGELASRAEAALVKAAGNRSRELTALRLFAAAAIAAVQMSRAVRTSNARYLRVTHSGTLAANLRRTSEGFECHFSRGEIKNGKAVAFEIVGDDALILRRWLDELRPRYMELRGLHGSPYLLPGDAVPSGTKEGLVLPHGCMARQSFDAVWKHGMAALGLDMTVHMCRHAVVMLVLALRPGDYALAASVIGDTEETTREHYGQDDGRAAALFVREALLAAHPGMLKKLERRIP